MNAITIQVVKNGYLVRDAAVQSDGLVSAVPGGQEHVFANTADLSYWMNGHLDPLVGEA